MIGVAFIGLVVHQCAYAFRGWDEKVTKYDYAQQAAAQSGKPLLVVGGPWGSGLSGRILGMKAHGCGDLCVDLDPDSCEGCPYLEADITDLPFTDGEFGAVFCSHVLEHMADVETIQSAWSELHRVADTVVVCVPVKQLIVHWLVPDHYLWVSQVEESVLHVEERKWGTKYLVDPVGPPKQIA